MKTSLYFLSNGMTLIAQAPELPDWGARAVILTDAYEIFVTPDESKLRFTMIPAFSLYGMLPYKQDIAIPQVSILCVRTPTDTMLQQYKTNCDKGEPV